MTIRITERDDAVTMVNDAVEVEVSKRFGPRIMQYRFLNEANVFGAISSHDQRVETPFGDAWHIYGGHRLWYAPEDAIGTYYPDNADVAVTYDGKRGWVNVVQATERHTGIQKSISLEMATTGTKVVVDHTLHHRGERSIELAPWALSVMAPSGRAIFPQARFVPHPTALAPARPIVVWPFTRMNDPRFIWGDRYIFFKHDPAAKEPQKIGFYDTIGWMAYDLGDRIFVKQHTPLTGLHADFGCNVETFANDAILELETLGPLVKLMPGASVHHREIWHLLRGMKGGANETEWTKILVTQLVSLGIDP